MGYVGHDQAAINAQLLADNEELRASLRAITAELAQLRQGGRPNGPRPPGRHQPDPHDTDSDADSTDDTRSQDEERPNRGGRRNARGPRAQVGVGRDHRGGRDREEEEPWYKSADPRPPHRTRPAVPVAICSTCPVRTREPQSSLEQSGSLPATSNLNIAPARRRDQ
ncbi:hypothetical protein Bca4012_092165 [Brassica carinata]